MAVVHRTSTLLPQEGIPDPNLPDGAVFIATGDNTILPTHNPKVICMRRSDAYAKFLSYEGCMQVFLSHPDKCATKYFIPNACIILKDAFQIERLLLKPMLNMADPCDAYGTNSAVNNVADIMWDDTEFGRPLYPALPKPHPGEQIVEFQALCGPYVRVKPEQVWLPNVGWLQKVSKHKCIYDGLLIVMRVSDGRTAPARAVFDRRGIAHPLGPPLEVYHMQRGADILVEISNTGGLVGEGKLSVISLFQDANAGISKPCHCSKPCGCKKSSKPPPSPSSSSSSDSGKDCHDDYKSLFMALTIPKTNRCGKLELKYRKGFRAHGILSRSANEKDVKEVDYYPYPDHWPFYEDPAPTRGHLRVSAYQAYDQLLAAALRACSCDCNHLDVTGHWVWLLDEWALLYGIRKYYQLLAHLRWILKIPIASATAACFVCIAKLIEPLLIAESTGGLTQLEAAMLSRVKADCEDLLRLAFENYYALRKDAPKGVAEGLSLLSEKAFEFPPPALRPAFHLFALLRDLFMPSDIEWLSDRFAIAAHKRWLRLAALTDDSLVREIKDSPDIPYRNFLLTFKLPDGSNPAYYAYKKLESVCIIIRNELQFDLALMAEVDLIPTSCCLPKISAAEFCTNLVMWLNAVLATYPPHVRSAPAIDLLVAVAQLARFVLDNRIDMEPLHPGHIDVMILFGVFITEWITATQEMLIATIHKLEKTATYDPRVLDFWIRGPIEGPDGSDTCGVSPLVDEMIAAITSEVHAYDRVVKFWPVFGPLLEAGICVVIRNVLVALCRQCLMIQLDEKNIKRNSKGAAARFAWQTVPGNSKGHVLPNGLILPTLLVRECVLMNSLKRLMVMVPGLEHDMAQWCGGAAVCPPGPPQPLTQANALGYDVEDVAPYIGAQFAQVVKELRTEYASCVSAVAERISRLIACNPQTNLVHIIQTAKPSTHTPSKHWQAGVLEHSMQPLFITLDACLHNLRSVLDPRVFVAVARGIWDFQGRDLFDFVVQLQEGDEGNRGAWKTRQNSKMVLEMLNGYFKKAIVACMERGGYLEENDVSLPVHPEKTLALLAKSSTLTNTTFSPF